MSELFHRAIALLAVIVLASGAIFSVVHIHVTDPDLSCQHDCEEGQESSAQPDTPSCCQLVPAGFVSLFGETQLPVVSSRNHTFRIGDRYAPAGWPVEIDLPPQLS